MAVLAWPTIATTEIDAESPIKEGLLAKYLQAHESSISQQVYSLFTVKTISLTTHGGATRLFNIHVPSWVNTADGSVDFVFQFEALRPSSPDGEYELKVFDDSSGERGAAHAVTITTPNAVYNIYEVRFPKTDFNLDLDEPDLYISCRKVSGTTCTFQNRLQGSHWERIA